MAAAAPAGDATTHAFVDALCPDILEALVHCLLVLQGCSPEVSTTTVATWHVAWGHALGAEMQMLTSSTTPQPVQRPGSGSSLLAPGPQPA